MSCLSFKGGRALCLEGSAVRILVHRLALRILNLQVCDFKVIVKNASSYYIKIGPVKIIFKIVIGINGFKKLEKFNGFFVLDDFDFVSFSIY